MRWLLLCIVFFLFLSLFPDDKTLHSRTDDVFLMAFLRGRKHNVDSAYKLVSDMCLFYYHVNDILVLNLSAHLDSGRMR